MFKNILVPLDGSNLAEAALPPAASLAQTLNAPVTLLHVVEGTTARALYLTIVANQWVSELSHAAYLGKELAKAELALQYGFKYVQDAA